MNPLFSFNLDNLINQWALLGLPALVLVLGTLASRFTYRGL